MNPTKAACTECPLYRKKLLRLYSGGSLSLCGCAAAVSSAQELEDGLAGLE
jgi:hypothetical protein